MSDALLWGGILRFTQAFLQAAPTILIGLIVAGVLRYLLGYHGTRRLFGGDSRWSLLQAWGVGMLLPVCSLGVIPVIREMRKAGLSGGTILAFALSAPLFNPLSLLYGLTLSEPVAILTFALCSLVIVTGVGLIWDRLFERTRIDPEQVEPAPPGLRRMIAIPTVASQEAFGPVLLYTVLGLGGVVLLSSLLPMGYLQSAAEHNDPWAPLFMSGIAIPAYATPMLAMSQLGNMFAHGNSIGAAFALLALGAGMNLGLLFWMMLTYGFRRSVTWMLLLEIVVVGLSYGVEGPLFPNEIEPAGHTHAFDIYCAPFTNEVNQPRELAMSKLRRDVQFYEQWSAIGLAALFSLGGLLRIADSRGRLLSWITTQPVDSQTNKALPWHQRPVPGPVLGAVLLMGLVAFSVVGCYAYYPSKQEVFEEMYIAKGEALSAAISGDHTHAVYWIDRWDDWTRKLQVGVYIRELQLSDYHRMKARILRDKLELLEHDVEDGHTHEVRERVVDIQATYTRLRTAYLSSDQSGDSESRKS
jgi:uncharacterized membrane protein YraQ (UPF0718 family)